MTYKVQEIFRWFENFEGKGILISGDTNMKWQNPQRNSSLSFKS